MTRCGRCRLTRRIGHRPKWGGTITTMSAWQAELRLRLTRVAEEGRHVSVEFRVVLERPAGLPACRPERDRVKVFWLVPVGFFHFGAGATREVRPAVPGDLSRGDLLVALPLFRVQDLHLCHHVNGHDNPPMSVFQGSGNGQYLDLEERARGEQAGHLNGCDGRPGRGRSRGYRI